MDTARLSGVTQPAARWSSPLSTISPPGRPNDSKLDEPNRSRIQRVIEALRATALRAAGDIRSARRRPPERPWRRNRSRTSIGSLIL
jgi:hypothetical protein